MLGIGRERPNLYSPSVRAPKGGSAVAARRPGPGAAAPGRLFRIAEEAIGRMPEKHVDRTSAVVKMDSLAPTRPAEASLERPPPTSPPARRGLAVPEHPPGVLRSAPPPRRLARRPGARGGNPRRLPRRASRPGASALRWADAADGDGVLVTVRRGKTNQEGETRDVRFVKDGVACALRTLRAAAGPVPEDQVVPRSPQMVGLRFAVAGRAAGVEARVTAHSGRVGLASELTSRGASTTDVMLAGNWKTSRMVAHYFCCHAFRVSSTEPWRFDGGDVARVAVEDERLLSLCRVARVAGNARGPLRSLGPRTAAPRNRRCCNSTVERSTVSGAPGADSDSRATSRDRWCAAVASPARPARRPCEAEKHVPDCGGRVLIPGSRGGGRRVRHGRSGSRGASKSNGGQAFTAADDGRGRGALPAEP